MRVLESFDRHRGGRVRALLLRRVDRDQPVIDGRVQECADDDVHLVDAVRRQRLSFPEGVFPAALFEFAVVGADEPGWCGRHWRGR